MDIQKRRVRALRWYHRNSKTVIARAKERLQEPEKKAARQAWAREHYALNAEKFKERARQWRALHREIYLARKREVRKRRESLDAANATRKRRLQSDPLFKIRYYLSNRLRRLLLFTETRKATSICKLIGCSMAHLREHIESQFKSGMSWDNYGKKGWELDHIIPCASFDLTDVEEQRRCFNFANLQPLWLEDNQRKGAKLSWTA